MKVRELIEHLQAFDQELPVFTYTSYDDWGNGGWDETDLEWVEVRDGRVEIS